MENNEYISRTANVHESVLMEAPVRLYGQVSIKKNCFLGKFTFINSRSTIHEGTTIGRYCSIGRNAEIGAWEHPIQRLSTSPISYGIGIHFPGFEQEFPQVPLVRPLETIIGNDVWLGSNVVIRRGVVVGSGAIIGTGSFVTKDVPPYAIVGGVPARLIRYRFPTKLIEKLMDVKWWELKSDDLATVPFDDVEEAIARLHHLRRGRKNDRSVNRRNLEEPRRVNVKYDIESLKAKIASIKSSPKKKDFNNNDFISLLRAKLAEANADEVLINFFEENCNKMYRGYDFSDPYDLVILNTKLTNVIDLFERQQSLSKGISNKLHRQIMLIMRQKE